MGKGALKNPLWTFPLAQIVSNGFTNFQNGNTDPINGDTKKEHFTRGTGQWGNSSWRQEASVVGSLLLPEASAWWKRGLHKTGGDGKEHLTWTSDQLGTHVTGLDVMLVKILLNYPIHLLTYLYLHIFQWSLSSLKSDTQFYSNVSQCLFKVKHKVGPYKYLLD